jgi:hypothetical protein
VYCRCRTGVPGVVTSVDALLGVRLPVGRDYGLLEQSDDRLSVPDAQREAGLVPRSSQKTRLMSPGVGLSAAAAR